MNEMNNGMGFSDVTLFVNVSFSGFIQKLGTYLRHSHLNTVTDNSNR